MERDSDAVAVAASLERTGSRSVKVIFKAGGWTLYPPVPPNLEIVSCPR